MLVPRLRGVFHAWALVGAGVGAVVLVILAPRGTATLSATVVPLATGGILYSAGAAVYARRRPDPWSRTLGFHEVFHLLVIAATLAHFVAMAGWVLPQRVT